MQTNILDEPSFHCWVYYDIRDDNECLATIYRFTTKELAEEFITKVPFTCSEVLYEEKRFIDGYDADTPYRPRFCLLEDALKDAAEFYRYGDKPSYIHYANVFRESLETMEKADDAAKKMELGKEIRDLCSRLSVLEKELTTIRTDLEQYSNWCILHTDKKTHLSESNESL